MTDQLPDPLVPPEVGRRNVSKRTRFEIFKRDGFACQYCGAHPPSVLLHVDHILALAAGGSNHVDNLVTACEPCNAGKGARPLSVAPQSLSEKAAEVAEREAQLLGYQALLEAKRQRLDDETWRVLEVFYPHRPESVPRDEFSSARRFIERMGVHAVLEAAEIAMAAPEVNYRRRFRYFCGVCWNKIREPQK